MVILTDGVVIGLRALSFVAVLAAAGAGVFVALFGRALEGSLDSVRARSELTAVAALLLELGYYLLIPARLGGSFGAAFDPTLAALLAESSVGPAHAVRFAGLGVLLVSFGLDERSRLQTAGCVLGAALVVGSFLVTGHTTIHSWRLVLAPLLLVHLATAAFWFGSLWPLALVATNETPARAASILGRFSALAVRAVPLLGLCGAAMALLFIRSFDELMTGYGALVLAKAAGYTALLGLAALNRQRLLPAIASARPHAVSTFRRVVAAEWALIALVVIATALMTELFAPENLHASFAEDHGEDANP